MTEDKITDFESSEYYRQRLKTAKNRTIFFAVLFFILGFLVARAIYLSPLVYTTYITNSPTIKGIVFFYTIALW